MAIQTPIRGLSSFCIVAKCLSFKHAAKQLYLTPSAVSHQIKLLEEQLGFTLFVRKTRSIELTPTGKHFYHEVRHQLLALEQTINEFKQKQHNQTIVISMPEFFASELFIPRLSQWTQSHPHINIQLETAKAGETNAKAVDLSIVLASGKPNASIVHELFPIRYVPACNQQVYKQYAQSGYDALKHVPLILHKSRPWSWHQWADSIDIEQFDPIQIIQFDSMFSVARAAQQGMGVALAPLPMSNAWFDEQSLVRLFDTELVTNDRYYLVQHDNIEGIDAMTEFALWVKNSFADLNPNETQA
jgi:LysR family glycine cleavage system transcriptional activator